MKIGEIHAGDISPFTFATFTCPSTEIFALVPLPGPMAVDVGMAVAAAKLIEGVNTRQVLDGDFFMAAGALDRSRL